jgi:hypothetical protein
MPSSSSATPARNPSTRWAISPASSASLGVKAFVFHEGSDPTAAYAFQEIARLTGGAACRFDASSPAELRALLRAVAAYASGGQKALADYAKREGGAVRLLEQQTRRR